MDCEGAEEQREKILDGKKESDKQEHNKESKSDQEVEGKSQPTEREQDDRQHCRRH